MIVRFPYVSIVGEHTRDPNWRRRGLASVGALTGLAVALWTVNLVRGSEACALADPAPRRTGSAVMYEGSVDGNCSLSGATKGDLFASVSSAEYDGSRACGGYLEVQGPRGTVRVQVIDRCPGCAQGQLDLSRAAFARIAEPGRGTASVAYRPVRDPKPARPLAFRVKPGSTSGWAAIQVIDHGNPLRSVELRKSGKWRDLKRGYDNYWVAKDGLRDGFTVRVTDADGRRAAVHDLDFAPGRIQRTKTKLYGKPKATPTPTPTPTPLTAPRETPTPKRTGC